MSIIFLAMPSRGTVIDGKVKVEVNNLVAGYHEIYPCHAFICPIIQDYQIVPYLTTTTPSWKQWANRCKQLIAVSDELWVLKYPEWNCSVGVAEEIEHAIKLNIPVRYVEIN